MRAAPRLRATGIIRMPHSSAHQRVFEQIGDKADPAAATVIQGDRQDERVEERDVVDGQQDPAVGRDALAPTTRRSASSHTSNRARRS